MIGRRAFRCVLAIVGIAAWLGCVTVFARSNPPWKIDEQIALRLAAEGYDHGVEQKWFDYDRRLGRPFFVFYGLTKSDGSFGYFAVNPWTGDVWALWGCHKLSSPALRRSQATIRRRFTRQELMDYPRLARLKPECVVED